MSDSDDQQQIKKEIKKIKTATKKIKKTKPKNDAATKKIVPKMELDSDDSDGTESEDENENVIPFDQPAKSKKFKTDEIVDLRNRQLFMLYPVKLPQKQKEAEDLLKPLNKRIIGVRVPRQKSFRWCLLEFATENDRIKAMKEISKVEVDGKKLVVSLPKLQSHDLLNKFSEKRREKRAKLKQKRKLKKDATKRELEKSYTSTIVVKKIPSSATAGDIKKLFPKAIDMRYTVAQGLNRTSLAYVTLPSPQHATKEKRQKHQFDGVDLLIEYSRPNANPGLKRKSVENTEADAEKTKKPKIEAVATLKTDEDATELIKPKQKKNKAKKLKVDAKSKPATSPAQEAKPVIVNKVKPANKNKGKITKPVAIKNDSPEATKMKIMTKADKPAMKMKAGAKNGTMSKKSKPNKQKKTTA